MTEGEITGRVRTIDPPADKLLVVHCADVVVGDILEPTLREAGFFVEHAADRAGLVALLGHRAPQLVVLCCEDALEIVETLRMEESTRELPTLVVSPDDLDRAGARRVQASGFLSIPFSAAEVREVLASATRKRRLVLLADDSPLIHRHTVPILEEAGYAVVSANDGEEGLALARERVPDLIITDVEMPRRDGYDFCKAIKEDPRLADIPVVICSSLGEAADLERGFDSGADDYLVKPVVPEELLSRLRTLLAGAGRSVRERILVVEDAPSIRQAVAQGLSRQGFQVDTAPDGKVGLERAQKLRYDLVITDYEMPVMTGFELTLALKRDQRTRDTPVMMLTARESRRDQAQMRAAGLTAYLVKPFSVDRCVAMAERILAEARLYAYKQASSVYISQGARRAAEERAARGDLGYVRADERVATVMFSDLVTFTQMSSNMEPRAVIEVLNEYFDRMCPIVLDEGGDIDKFIGDAVMAVFEERRDLDRPELRAVRAGLRMQEALRMWNATRGSTINMRIGINTGPLVRGDLGSRFVRRDYTVIGDTVNRANRFEANAPHGGVMVSKSTYDPIRERVVAEERQGVVLKGVGEAVVAYVIQGLR
jgi:CheY-like chemotaxis protein/class 3 adenylate cyclase